MAKELGFEPNTEEVKAKLKKHLSEVFEYEYIS